MARKNDAEHFGGRLRSPEDAELHGIHIPLDNHNMPEVIHDEAITVRQRGGRLDDDQLSRDQEQVYGSITDRAERSHRPGRGGNRPKHGL